MGVLDAPALSPINAAKTFAAQRRPTIVLFGDSRTSDCDYTDAQNGFSTNMSWWDWGQHSAPSGPVFDVLKNSGVFGNTTTQMVARFTADVLAYAPSHMTMWGGTNDDWSTGTAGVDASFANIVIMCEQARRAGIYVFLIGETTCSTKGNAFAPLVQYYNDRLRHYAAQNPQIEFWDFNGALMNPTASNGTPTTTMVRDGLHLSAFGAVTIGQKIVGPRLARFAPLVALPNSLIDTQGYSANVRNVLTNPLMQGSSGTLGTNNTGTLPTSWAGSNSNANVSQAFSVVARADGFGNDLQSAVTHNAAGTAYVAVPITVSRLVAGSKYVLELAYSLASPVNIFSLSFTLQVFNGGTLYEYGFGKSTQSPTGTPAVDGLPAMSGILRSRPITIPSGFTPTAANITAGVRSPGVGSATLKFGRIALRPAAA